jgi:hypothetical protein
MLKKKFGLCLVLIFGLLHYGAASAIVVEVIPSSSIVNMGGSLTADIRISGLGDGFAPSLGTYDIDLIFDSNLFTPNSVTFGDPVLGHQLDLFGFMSNPSGASLAGPNTLNLFEVSLDFPFDLDDLQAPAFILASVVFDVNQKTGTGLFDLSINALGDSFAFPLDAQTIAAEVQVVPVPAAIWLFGTGLIGLIGFAKRRAGIST